MKVLIIYHCGLSDDAKSIFREYARQGIDLKVIVPSEISIHKTVSISGYLNHKDEHNEKGYCFIPVDLRKPNSYGEGFKFFQLFRAIKKAKPDIIHVIDEYSSFYLAQTILCRDILYGKKVPVLSYAYQNIPFEQFKFPPFLLEFSLRFFKRIARKILHPLVFFYHKKHLNGFTGTNIQALENIKALGTKAPNQLIYWGIDFKVFYQKDCNLCREKIGIPKDIKLVGYFGRIAKEKGLDKLVMAISRMSDYYLMIIGNGIYEHELNKKIDFLGIRDRVYKYNSIGHDELGDYYNCLNTFVLPTQITPSCKEQYGKVLVEAMACQIAVVGSCSGAIPNVLHGYPKHLIFKEDNVDDLINKIRGVEKLKFPDNFELNKFLYKFSIENFVEKHIDFYKKLRNGFK